MKPRKIQPAFKASAAAAKLVRGHQTEIIDTAGSFLTALQCIARGRRARGDPLDAEVARQLARQALHLQGEAW